MMLETMHDNKEENTNNNSNNSNNADEEDKRTNSVTLCDYFKTKGKGYK